MEKATKYLVETTPEAEFYFLQLLEYLYSTHSKESADNKADEVLNLAMSLENNPYRGRVEDKLLFLEKGHRFLLYRYTPRKSIKVIYFIDESMKKVYITDFFGTEMDDQRISERSNPED